MLVFKNRSLPVVLCGLLVLSVACQEKKKPAGKLPAGFSILSRGMAERKAATAKGKRVAAALLSELKSRLLKRIGEKGLASALTFCSIEGLPLTKSLAQRQGKGIRIKRTSLKYRNPKNAPDALDAGMLRWFEKQRQSTSRLPTNRVIRTADYYRYYQPLTIGGMCLGCHGDKTQIAAPVKAVLLQRFPRDLAVGYKLNDFRGLIRVDIPRTSKVTPKPESTP